MRLESSKLARLIAAYLEKLGQHVPEPALWEVATLIESSARGCTLHENNPEPSIPEKRADGK
jgi:hypothetical protein